MKVGAFLFVPVVFFGLFFVSVASAEIQPKMASGLPITQQDFAGNITQQAFAGHRIEEDESFEQQIWCQRAEKLLLPEIVENPKSESEFKRNIELYHRLGRCSDEYKIRAGVESDMLDIIRDLKY